MNKDIIGYKNFLTYQDYEELDKVLLKEHRWNPFHKSTESSHLFWQMELDKDTNSYFFTSMLDKIKKVTTQKHFDVERVYFNGHNACSSGALHQDTNKENGRTFLIYCNRVWNPVLGGGTVFQKSHDNIFSIYPYPGSAVYFPGNIPHCALPISKDFNGVRITLAYKLYI